MIDPQLEQLIAMGGQSADMEDQVAQQMAKAKMLRGMPAPQGQQIGRIHVAPTLLQNLAHGLTQHAANNMESMAGQTKVANSITKQQQMAMLMRMLQQSDQQAQPSQAQGMGMMPPDPNKPNGNGMVPPQGAY